MDHFMKIVFAILLITLTEGKSLDGISLDQTNLDGISLEDLQLENQILDLDVEVEDIFDKEVTYPGIGTFKRNDFFDTIHRPLLLLPESPSKINPKFFLYTRKNPKEAQSLSWSVPADNKATHFDPKHQTKFIIHGFLDNQLFGKWMQTLKDEFLILDQFNVIIVDWSGGNGLPYGQATVNTRVVGAVMANLIKSLEETHGVSLKDVHLIGHSLGAQTCGYAGERIKVGRITGLDPAGPYFEWLPIQARLDKSDAEFVDVIHTDSRALIPYLGFGCEQAVGHVDFYPNGGKDQPKCDKEKFTSIIFKGIAEGLRRLVACNHQRAVDFFIASINHEKNIPVGYKCTDFDAFKQGLCSDCGPNGDKCAVMGYRADEFRKYKDSQNEDTKLFLKTTGDYPYFVTNYQIKVKLGHSDDRDPLGSVIVILKGEKSTENVVILDKEKIVHDSTYNYLLNLDHNLGKITKVSVEWKTGGLPILSKNKVNFEKVTIDPMFVWDKMPRQPLSFCNKNGNVKTHTEVDLSTC